MQPPFLELSYYVGLSRIAECFERLQPGRKEMPRGSLPARGAVGLIEGAEELEVASGTIVLRTEGGFFCGPARENQVRLLQLGDRVSRRFLQISDLLRPHYGAILVEYSLEEPRELPGASSLAFQDFFVGTDLLDEAAVRTVIELAGPNAYVERRPTGVYVAMSREFGMASTGVAPVEAQERSVRIGAFLAGATKITNT